MKSYEVPERPPAMPDDVWGSALMYRPRDIAEKTWNEIRPVVLTVVARYSPTTLLALKRTLHIVSQHFAWAVQQHLPLDIDTVLSPDPIARFVGQTAGAGNSDATRRSRLNGVARKVTVKAPWPGRNEPLARTVLRAPYSNEEILGYLRQADRQNSRHAERAFHGLLVLCHGAGATPGQAVRALTSGLHRDEFGRWCVRLDSPDRVVPLVEDYVDLAQQLAAAHPGQPFLTSGKRRLSWLSSTTSAFRLDTTATVPTASRLRTTWIVNRLNSGANLKVLATAAGLASGTFLTDVLPYLSDQAKPAHDPMTAALSPENQAVGLSGVTA